MTEKFGELLGKYREKQGCTQWELYGELAERCPRYTGLRSGSIVSRWEHRERRPPPYETILALEDILKVPDNLLLKAAGYTSTRGREGRDLSTFLKEWDEFIDLIEQFNDSLSRIGIKDFVVWHFEGAPCPPWHVPSTDKHPAELYAESTYGGLKVDLKIEKMDEVRFRQLLFRLKRRYPEFKKFEEWKNRLGVLVKECQGIAREIWLAAEDSKGGTGMKMANLFALPPIREGLYHVPKFIYDFAVDNYKKDIRPSFQVVEHDDKLYKHIPEDDPDYDPEHGLALGSQEAMERCKETTINLCERYARDRIIGEKKGKEKKVKAQAAVFQGILSRILTELVQ